MPLCDLCKNKMHGLCTVCNGSGKLKSYLKVTVVEDCLSDIWVKCTEDLIPLKVLTSSKGNLIVNETQKSVIYT
jgi:hypothetical protein